MLKAIGVVRESKKRAEEPYQDSVTAPLDQEDERDIDEEEGNGKDDDWEDKDEGAAARYVRNKLHKLHWVTVYSLGS
jgi:hypothetical protein